jgi:putative ABC transport system permease protein
MTALRVLVARLGDVLLRRSRENRLSEEVQSHLDALADDYAAQGMSPADARLAARKAFGGVDQVKERYRDQRGLPLVNGLLQDAHYSSRLIVRDRWFTVAIVAALALGIASSSTMVSLLYGMSFRGLPFDDADALVGITGAQTRTQGRRVPFGVFDAWQSSAKSFALLAAEVDEVVNLGDEANATDQFAGTYVSHSAFGLLRVRPILGRDFRPEDDRVGAAPVAIIGHRVWSERYGSDPAVLGRTVRANGQAATVIGVMPEGFMYPIDQQVWRPLAALPGMDGPGAGQRLVRIIGRLADGVTIDQARSELSTILSTLPVPEADRTRRTVVQPLNDMYVGRPSDAAPMMMLAAVMVVLLIACSHAASLMLARSAARAREMSMRAALGASRLRIVRQLLVESVLLALAAGVIGGAFAWVGARTFAAETTGFGMPYWIKFTFDFRLVLYIAALSTGAGITFGLLPALNLSHTKLTAVLNQGGRTGTPGRRARRTTTLLLVGELALTVVLLASAGALVRSAAGVYQSDQMLDLARLWEFRVALPESKYARPEQRQAFYRALDERLAAAPGLESAALAGSPPFNARENRDVIVDNSSRGTVPMVAIGDRYFETLGLEMVRGESLKNLAPVGGIANALVNERFAERYFPGRDPIGQDVWLAPEAEGATPERYTIVGIAPPLRQQVASGNTPAVYVPHASQPGRIASLLVRGRPEMFADALRQEVRRLDPDLPLFNLQSLERVSGGSRFVPRMMSAVFAIVAVIATLLSALGLYAITAYATAQRTQEVGVRMALGARRSQIAWLFLKSALGPTAMGLTIGLAGAVAAGGLLQGVLVDVRANSPIALLGVLALLVTVSITATLLPARRASRLDPVTALRVE